jgi:hypothetical protein
MTTRRTFLFAGIAGAAALAAAAWWRAGREMVADGASSPLGSDGSALMAAVIPVFLDGALPAGREAAAAAAQRTLGSVGVAVAGLPPAAQKELGQLFALLGTAPGRIALARVTLPWHEAKPEEIAAFLERWRTSGFLLLHSAYAALHQLVFAAWYGDPASWPAIGYPGPPKL